ICMHHGRRVLLAIGIVLATAGCGGTASGAATAAPSVPAAATAAPDAATPAAAASDAPATAPAAAGGGSSGGVCDLVTSDELSQALGQDTQTTLVPGPPDTCGIASNDGT